MRVSTTPTLSPTPRARIRVCIHITGFRGRYEFYERRRASEGGRSDAFDTIYKRRDAAGSTGEGGKGRRAEAGLDGAQEVAQSSILLTESPALSRVRR